MNQPPGGRGGGGGRGRGRGGGRGGGRGEGRGARGGGGDRHGDLHRLPDNQREESPSGRGGGRGGGGGGGGRRLDRQTFQELLELSPQEILYNISNQHNQIGRFFTYNNCINQLVLPALQVIDKALEATDRNIRLQFMASLTESNFFSKHLLKYTTDMMTGTRYQEYAEVMRNISSIIGEILEAMPSSNAKLFPLIATLQMVFQHLRLKRGDIFDDSLAKTLEELSAISTSATQSTVEKKKKKNQIPDINEDELPPPEDYRDIGICPTLEDINLDEKPFLRVNKAKGGYQNTDHYLDVQFRLLREDFIRPLREGIEEYREALTSAAGKKRYQNIKIYTDVRIMQPVCTQNGLLYQLQFDATKLGMVRWQSSKRLIYASLVCLSNDDFQTLTFATVANRDPDKLKQGLVDVKFDGDPESISEIGVNEVFVMAETTAYFEAYRHVLKGLQNTGELPFEDYIVQCTKDVLSPRYLRRNRDLAIYDMSCIMKGKTRKKNVPVLDITRWPDHEDFGLDKSQHHALQTALTKEFALIQGPPGTGKTFIGLQIVKVMLENNVNVRAKGPRLRGQAENTSAILVICYTNHALDQFLEGIYEFQREGIVRVGGRSRSEEMKKFNLSNIKKERRENKVKSRDISHQYFLAKKRIGELEEVINQYNAKLEVSQKGILHENVFKDLIDYEQFDELDKMQHEDGWGGGTTRGNSVMKDFLGCGRFVQREIAADNTDEEAEDDMVLDEIEDEEEEEDEGEDEDAQIMTAQRMLEDLDLEPTEKDKKDGLMKAMRLQAESELAVNMDDAIQGEDEEGWQMTKQDKKKMKKRIMRNLQIADAMTQEEAGQIKRVWRLDLDQRWRLYRYWLQLYRQDLRLRQRELEVQFQRACDGLQEARFREDQEVMRDATIIGMTTTGAARYQSVLQELNPGIVIVEEAAEVLESHIVTSLSPGCQHLILIGDHKQLRPTPTVYELAIKYQLDISLFERMVKNDVQCVTLGKQHRMRPEVSKTMALIYPELEDAPNVKEYEAIRGVSSNMFFISHTQPEDHDSELMSKSNRHEARYIPELASYLIKQGYTQEQITILTMYTGQVFLLKKELKKLKLKDIRVSAVDNYQGEENEIILLSLVRCNRENKIGFLSIENRVCVALSRARKGFYVIGAMDFLAYNNDLWRKVVKELTKARAIGPGLRLYCQNHPNETPIIAEKANDFLQAPEGGCKRPCEARLNCGHTCPRICHTYDMEHKEYNCSKPCQKENRCGHICKRKCHQPCGDCLELVTHSLSCGHQQLAPCSQKQVPCDEPCQFKLHCGHLCQGKCGQEHTRKCEVKVDRVLKCGHTKRLLCHKDPEKEKCTKACNQILDCQHPCQGTCGTCYQGRLHISCGAACGRTQVCGHLCKEPCTKECPPCTEVCQNRCVHSKCTKSCGEVCEPCREPCAWRCEHFKCTKLCCEPCNRPPCNHPCKLFLRCGHPCIGLCGENCPDKCKVCHKDEVEAIFFGDEDEPDARFVQLVGCGHVFEVNGLDTWMDNDDRTRSSTGIQLKQCPRCRTPVRQNLRYGSQINAMLEDIARVKVRKLGDHVDLPQLQNKMKLLLNELSSLEYELWKDLTKRRDIFMNKPLQLDVLRIQLELTLRISESHRDARRIIDSEVPDPNHPSQIWLEELGSLKDWVLKPRARFSEQELKEIQAEIDRYSLLLEFVAASFKLKRPGYMKEKEVTLEIIREALDDLRRNAVLTYDRKEEYKMKLKKVQQVVGGTTLGISDEERKQIVQAMGYSTKGHWYKCPNNHIYTIGDCGGATNEGTCPECSATIGGSQHKLRSDNRLASEMDGAQHAAWSEHNNMENYGFNQNF